MHHKAPRFRTALLDIRGRTSPSRLSPFAFVRSRLFSFVFVCSGLSGWSRDERGAEVDLDAPEPEQGTLTRSRARVPPRNRQFATPPGYRRNITSPWRPNCPWRVVTSSTFFTKCRGARRLGPQPLVVLASHAPQPPFSREGWADPQHRPASSEAMRLFCRCHAGWLRTASHTPALRDEGPRDSA